MDVYHGTLCIDFNDVPVKSSSSGISQPCLIEGNQQYNMELFQNGGPIPQKPHFFRLEQWWRPILEGNHRTKIASMH